jgi:alpha-galactosidase
MAKIVFIGAGSLIFTRNLVRDIISFPLLENATIVLMDINKERLVLTKNAVQYILDKAGSKAKMEITTNRSEALKNADAVICTILAQNVNVWRYDVEIPKKYGVDINVGDSRGPAAIFRALRSIPVMLDICKDMEKLCPDAILLNYTNPMGMLCSAMQKSTFIKVVGLCHSVQGTAEMLANWIKAPMNKVTYKCAGINHQAWYLDFRKNDKDAYPLIRKAVSQPKIYNEEIVRNEMFMHLGYYVTESSGHNSEYNWWFRKRPDLIKKYCTNGTGWNPGTYGFLMKQYLRNEKTWKKQLQKWVKESKSFSIERGNEYAAYIINAYLGYEPFEFNGNVPNTGLISNLPLGGTVEVPIFVNHRNFNPVHIGALPPQLAALNAINMSVEEMAVKGVLAGDAEMIFHAIAYDPVTASALSLAEIKKMVNAMLKQNKSYLKTFKHTSI